MNRGERMKGIGWKKILTFGILLCGGTRVGAFCELLFSLHAGDTGGGSGYRIRQEI